MTEITLRQELKKNEIRNIYLLFGQENFSLRHSLSLLEKSVCPDNDPFGRADFEGNASIQEVYDAALSMPFMCDRKLVVWCDYPITKYDDSDYKKLISLYDKLLKNTQKNINELFYYIKREEDNAIKKSLYKRLRSETARKKKYIKKINWYYSQLTNREYKPLKRDLEKKEKIKMDKQEKKIEKKIKKQEKKIEKKTVKKVMERKIKKEETDMDIFFNDNYKVLSFLYDNKDEKNNVKITHKEISKVLNLSRNTIVKILKILKDSGYVIQPPNKYGSYQLSDKAVILVKTINMLKEYKI